MSISRAVTISALITLASGCGGNRAPAAAPATSSAATATGPKIEISDAQRDIVRKGESSGDAAAADAADQQASKYEKDLLKAMNMALGKQPSFPGGPMPEPASTVVKALRTAKIKLRVEPVVDSDGEPVANNFVQVKDSFTDRVQQLSRKMAEQTASKAEIKEIQSGTKYIMKLQDIKSAVQSLSMVTLQTTAQAPTSNMTLILQVAGMVKSRKMYEMEWTDADYSRVARLMERQRRIEAIGGASMGLLAVYMGVLNDGGDPAAIDALCGKAVDAFPFKPTVSDDEAKDYVKNLSGNVAAAKAQYEDALRKVHGDAVYDKKYKASTDLLFKQAEGAGTQKSVNEMANDSRAKYKVDIDKCTRGEPISPGSMVSPPRCKQVHDAAVKGEPIPDTLDPSVAAAPAADSGGLAGGLLDSAFNLPIPGLAMMKGALKGIQALAKGDSQGALNAALDVVPGGQLAKKGVEMAVKAVDTAKTVVATAKAVTAPADNAAALREGLGLAQKLLAGSKYDPAKAPKLTMR
jgi:hypothetical protein